MKAVATAERVLPWWCRTFGHTYRRDLLTLGDEQSWYRPVEREVVVMCRRCGDRP